MEYRSFDVCSVTIIPMIGTRELNSSKQNLAWRREAPKSNPESNYKKIQNYIFNFAELLGQGNFSKVYRGRHQITNEVVAIKIIELNSLKSKKLQELLFSEIDILKKLNHPNILKCHEVFTSNRNCYIVTEQCNEGDLQSKLRTKKYMREEQAEAYIKDIFKGLMYLADFGIVHRDIKVSNIFINNGTAKIADFGFAKLTRTKFKDINIGSPIYMSPEGFIDNIYGPKTDIWAFGVLIYQLLHGQTPYSHCKSESELKYNLAIPIGWSQLKAELSTDIKEAILKCLEVDEPKRISALQLRSLAYFRSIAFESPQRQRKDVRNGFSYDYNAFKSELHTYPVKSESEGFFEQGKYRIKTQNQSFKKKTQRQLTGLSFGKYSRDEKDFLRPTKDSTPYLKTILEDQKYSKHSNSSTNLSVGYQKGQLTLNKINSAGKTEPILSSAITFRECVNILHYCRLIFKHLMLMKEMGFGDQNQRSIFKRWLSTVLKSIMREIEDKRVICDGENIMARERKLEEVTNEYMKKYSKELDLDFTKVRLQESAVINYGKICNYFASIHQLIDQLVSKDTTNPQLLNLAHSMVMVVNSSKIMKQCFQERNYKWVEKLKEIQEFLGTKKENLDYTSYQWYKKNYL